MSKPAIQSATALKKRSRDASGYLPSSVAYRCAYVARQIGVPYVQRTEAGLPDTALMDVARPAPQPAGAAHSGTELYWVLSGLAAVLLLVELFLTLREAARTRLDRVRL